MTTTREETQAKLDKQSAGVLKHTPDQEYTLADRFEECAERLADHTFLIYQDHPITYAEVNQEANRYAALMQKYGIESGDVGALMLENRPEFFYVSLAFAKLGVTAALINTQARGKALEHALKETRTKLLFLGSECSELYETTTELDSALTTLTVPDGTNCNTPLGCQIATSLLPDITGNPDKASRHGIVGETPVFYVFTSGTTGLPKAALISHMRWLGVGDGWKQLLEITSDDVFYCFLPLFHGAAGMSLVSNALAAGACIVVKRKFSASQFWNDVRRYKVTTAQYIGEICRYLTNVPTTENDKNHTLKRMTGAGMAPDVWRNFLKRFGDIDIIEGWGATESNCALINVDGKIGSCGRIPFKDKSNIRLARYDVENDAHFRDSNGFLVEAAPGETGEILGMILNIPGVGAGRFEGYTNAEATEKKILRNVFQEGDAWFRSGDLVREDEDGYVYFADRVGDTFRWKSENVSTTEVMEALSSYPQVETINVYGVAVPEHEGRAGMIALQLQAGARFDPKRLYQIATQSLPHYAVPLFVRLSEQSDMTATFKLRKVELQKEGYDPSQFKDPLYVLNHETESYLPYNEAALEVLGIKPFAAGN